MAIRFMKRPQLSGKCKSKPQWDITSHLLGWPLSKRQEITSAGEDVERREALYTAGGHGRQYEDTSKN